jgi:Icc-related predicted phosphoesterase
VDFLTRNVTSSDIVVTHMLPHPNCINSKYAGDPVNHFFMHDMSDLIERVKPRFWVFGHTHHAVHIKVGSTHLLANPRGYPRETGSQFDQFAEFDI